jgi:hypothetical protein
MVHSFVISLIFLLRCARAAAVVCVCLRHGATNLLLAVVSSLVALFGFQLPIDSRPARKLLPRLPFLATMVCCLVHACLSSFIIYRRQVAVWVCAALFAFFLSLLLVLQLIISCCLRRSALLAALLVSGNIISPTRH